MDAAVALQRKKTIKNLSTVDFSLSKQGIFFVTLRQKAVTIMLPQPFFFVVTPKIDQLCVDFWRLFLWRCPPVFKVKDQLSAQNFPIFRKRAGERSKFSEKMGAFSRYFQIIFNFLQ